MIVLDPKCLAWFGLMLCVSAFALTYVYRLTNNEYIVMKQQTKGNDYEKRVVKLWLPFFGLILLMIGLCVLPFYVFPPPEFIN